MRLLDILHVKGTEVHAIGPESSVDNVVQQLVHHRCGSLVVRERGEAGGRMIGIITERDILRAQAGHRAPLDKMLVAVVMTTDLITANGDDTVEHAMGLMTNHRVRHLPIVNADELIGMISIGDIVKAQHDHLLMENHYMRSYIQGKGAEVGTLPLDN